MKNSRKLTAILILIMSYTFTSCKKEECHECHYDGLGEVEVELGEKCGDELKDLEANGYAADGTVYEVHCHGH